MSEQQVRVGVGVFVIKDGKFIIGERTGSHDANTWSIPGGHLDFGETPEETAVREVMEETGLEVANPRFCAFTNDIFEKDNKHYISIWMFVDWVSGKEAILEPDKCLEWTWVDFDTLPEPLFSSWNQLKKSEFYDHLKKELKKS